MLYKQRFKSLAGAQKRAAFENAHCNQNFRFLIKRFSVSPIETLSAAEFDKACRNGEIWWQLEKVVRVNLTQKGV